MNIIIAGATGFAGSNIAQTLSKKSHNLILMVRPASESRVRISEGLSVVKSDPGRNLDDVRVEADALINAIGIIREFPSRGITFRKIHVDIVKNLLDFARSNAIDRFIQISALGAGPDGRTEYQRSKFEAEELIRESGLNWTILRPSMMLGPGDHVTGMFTNMVKWFPAVPVIGDGKYVLQPVHIDDVAEGISRILDDQRTFGKTYEIGGPEILTYDQILDRIGATRGKKRIRKLHQPVGVTRLFASLLGQFQWFPVTDEQITMLLDGNSTSETAFFDLYGIEPRKPLG